MKKMTHEFLFLNICVALKNQLLPILAWHAMTHVATPNAVVSLILRPSAFSIKFFH